ncbi:hypothetical protein CHN44_20790, partial [Vibrio cholerae]
LQFSRMDPRASALQCSVRGGTATVQERAARSAGPIRPPEGGCGTEPAIRAARGIDDDQARGFSGISHVSMTSPSLMSLNDPRPMPHS